ncbi:hypothetical protein [Flavobacteriaceae bacterium 14752]|uniref:hypothetical protein n=1 Tax=Mesohalobacter salilacus TaxID=2491711 RepID=UPI000F6318DD|nr:hypothetical protein EIG84_07270 [Flavobacteriaceae bacterium 14752]
MTAKRKKEIFFISLIIIFISYAIYKFIERKISEDHLDENHIYIAVTISKIRYGRISSADFVFKYINKQYKEKEVCGSSELNNMNIGDIYLAKFNEDIEFSELMCGCKLSKSDKGKVWEKFPGCKN